MKLIQRDPVEDDTEVYEVQQILNHQPIEGTTEMEYLVRWKGYASEHDSWIPFKNFIETTMIEKYRKRRGLSDESDDLSGPQPVRQASKVQKTRGHPAKGSLSSKSKGQRVQRPPKHRQKRT